MEDKFINVPTNVEDTSVLKRFLTELVDKLNSNALISGPILYPADYTGPANLGVLSGIGEYTNSILEAAARLDKLSGDAKNYITGNLQTEVLSNSQDVATITEQFGTFYDTATAAAWYGLTVKTGELISGFTLGGVDSDTTTPGTAGSFFTISADKFSVGRAIEDITNPAELAYIQANGLPYGTMYNTSTSEIIPAFLIEWNGTGYDTFFNGKVTFSNISDANTTIPTIASVSAAQATADSKILASQAADAINNNTTTISGSKISTGTITAAAINATTDIGLPSAPISGYTWLSAIVGDTSSYDCGVSGRGKNAGVAGEATLSTGYGIYGYGITYDCIGVYGEASSNHGVLGRSNTSRGVTGESTSGYGVYGGSQTSHGIVGAVNGSGYGFYTTAQVWLENAAYPFTGAHIVLSLEQPNVGDILEVTNTFNLDISNIIAYVKKASILSKAVFGVYNGEVKDIMQHAIDSGMLGEDFEDSRRIKPEFIAIVEDLITSNYYLYGVNAVGEGMINVCSEGGDISIGDYICSSNIPGKGMRQTDDILHSYTVAKALETVTWANETSTIKLIACTYHCG